MGPHQHTKNEWYRMDTKDVVRELKTDISNGLSGSMIAERRRTHGTNAFKEVAHATMLERIVAELKNPLTFILLSAGIVTTLLAEYVDSTVIFIALIINIIISLYQEGRADKAFDRLRASQQFFSMVIRDGVKMKIAAEELVVGDVVLLEAGMNVPADIRLVLAGNLEVNESPLTGEWIEVAKHAETQHTVVPFVEQKNMVFMGTLVTGGSGTGIVVDVGDNTKIGAIAGALSTSESLRTPLQENVARVARFLSYIVLGSLVLIFILGALRGMAFTELLLISIAIAVAAIPEGLPAAVTVILALGMESILKRGGLVRNLLAAETLGSTTVILTDKTGTLTKAEMVVAHVVTYGGVAAAGHHQGEHILHEAHGDERDVLEFAALASDAFIERQEKGDNKDPLVEQVVRGRPVERAIVRAALLSGLDQTELLRNYPRIDFLPFESKYRIALSLHHVRGLKHNRLYVTGAPEYILSHTGAIYIEGKAHINSSEKMEELERQLKHYTDQGMRLIGVAYRDTTVHAFEKNDDETRRQLTEGLILAGFVVLHDPLRDDVKTAIADAKHAGAHVIMATGDNPNTARTIAAECGIWQKGDTVLLGEEVEKKDDAELFQLLKRTTVFARMLPEHKLRIARILQAKGEVVAMTGDGVNDAPALRAANIGVALGSGTEVAKEASDLILLNNSFSIIVAAIEEGRRIVDNLRKVIAYLLSTSFTEIILVGGALILGLPLPILPAQILWTNMLSEGFMNFAFAFEPKEDDLMRRDPKVAGARMMLSKTFTRFIVAVGVCSGSILLGLFYILARTPGESLNDVRTVVFVVLTLGTTLIAFSLKDLRTPLYRIRFWSNAYLLVAFLFTIAGLLLALHWGVLARLLRLSPDAVSGHWLLVVGSIVLTLGAVEIAKYLSFGAHSRRVIK